MHKFGIDSTAGAICGLLQCGDFTSSKSESLSIMDLKSTRGIGYIQPSTYKKIRESYGLSSTPEVGYIFAHPTPRHRRSDKLSKELDDIYVECSGRNWDGYGARPIFKSVRKYVNKFLDALPVDTPTPELSPDPDGEISLEWCYARNKMFSISIGKKGRIAYAVLDGERRSSGTEVFEKEMPESIIFQLKNFLEK